VRIQGPPKGGRKGDPIISQVFVSLLAIIAGIMAWGLYKKRVMWKGIVLYRCVLTVKNEVDLPVK